MEKRFSWAACKFTLLGVLLGIALTAPFAFKILKEKPACAISLDKQNIFYTGVDNPVSIVVSGVPEEDLIVDAQGIRLKRITGDDYVVNASMPGEAKITVSGGEIMRGVSYQYRVKRIPDPEPLLGGKYGSGSIGNGVFKAQKGLEIVMRDFDFDAHCDMVSFEVSRMAKREDPNTIVNTGANFNPETKALINRAEPGIVYFFDDIRVKCPGDAASRYLSALSFKIK